MEGSCRTLETLQISTQNGYGRALSRCWRRVGCEHCAWKGSLAFSRKPIPMFQNPADSAVPKAGRDALGQDVQAQCMRPSGRILVPGRFYYNLGVGRIAPKYAHGCNTLPTHRLAQPDSNHLEWLKLHAFCPRALPTSSSPLPIQSKSSSRTLPLNPN